MQINKKSVSSRIAYDQGPPERRQHNKVVVELDARNTPRLRVVDQTEFDRLLHERKISLDQHSAGEHMMADLVKSGYVMSCNWVLDSSIRGDRQAISSSKSDALLKSGLGQRWLLQRLGRGGTALVVGAAIGTHVVRETNVPIVRRGLETWMAFEGWFYGRKGTTLPELLQEFKVPRRS